MFLGGQNIASYPNAQPRAAQDNEIFDLVHEINDTTPLIDKSSRKPRNWSATNNMYCSFHLIVSDPRSQVPPEPRGPQRTQDIHWRGVPTVISDDRMWNKN